jgi:hypothetical protein
LAGFIAVAAETIHKLPVASKLEDAVVEPAQRVNITRTINGDSRG